MTKSARGAAGRVIGCDLLTEGVVITFWDLQSFLFDPGLLYNIRDKAILLAQVDTDDSNSSSPV